MLAKMTSKKSSHPAKKVIAAVPRSEYFNVTEENGRIVLTPVRINRADAVRAKIAEGARNFRQTRLVGN